MTRWVQWSVMLTVVLVTGSATAIVTYDIPRYQVILDREPFGAVPIPVVVPDKPVEETPLIPDKPPAFIKSLRMCAITEADDFGLRVGIVDIKAKPAKSYFFRLGDTQDGIEMIDADFEKEGALLKKDGQAYWIYLNGSTGSGRDIAKAIGSPPPPRRSAAARRPTTRTSAARGSYAERLRKRREILDARRKKAKERENIGPEALKAQLQDYQMDLIRAGGELGPALPIPLTRKMDDKLVAEGVLPPQK